MPKVPLERYKGVRQRHWGSWVSEIRHPAMKTRLWLGTYSTEERAARAYDEAAEMLNGPAARMNFPASVDVTGSLHAYDRAKVEKYRMLPPSSSTAMTKAAPVLPPSQDGAKAVASSSSSAGAGGGAMIFTDDLKFIEEMIKEMTHDGPIELVPISSVRSATQ
ncbi:hypothetical protein BRADI_5g24710v3 [Brachypodium distachyon]|uniref:AP2/ERF domain-containing protein n=1 Tax=Brachypodium distachyon TaxID=15368 RepID=I1J2V3_BRADI|nr:hypothetical protein BRADI_5g24710v3 [Brachypodium distachyon]